MAWEEVAAKRTAKAKVYRDTLNPRRFRAEFTIHDQHYKDNAGAWQDVDESLATDGADGFDRKCEKTRHVFRAKSGGAYRWYPRRDVLTEYVDITEIQYYTNRWRTLNLPAAVWKSQGAEWDMANLYASITNTWKRIKTEFILKNATAYTRLRFAVAFTGLSYNDTTGELTSTTDGLVWGRIDKPVAVDTNEAPVVVTQTYSGGWIEWEVVPGAATYPIYVDPTFTDGYGGDVTTYKDAKISSVSPNNNYGAIATTLSGSGDKDLLEFDLSSIAATSTCDSATFYRYMVTPGSAQAWTCTIYSIAVGNDGWIEGTQAAAQAASGEPCWNAKVADGAGGVTTAWAGSAGLSTSGDDYEASSIGSYSGNRSDVAGTEYTAALTASRVEDWFGASNTNYGIVDDNSTGCGALGTSDNATTGYRPKLVVVYSTGATGTLNVTLAAATASSTGTVEVKGAASITLAAATSAATGTVTINGAASINLAAATVTATGGVQIDGALDATLGAATVSATGTVVNAGAYGALDVTLAPATAAATGTVSVSGAANITLADTTVSASGTVAIDGDLSQTLGNATLSAAGVVAIDGDASITLADATVSATGTVSSPGTATGTLSVTLADATSTATGTVSIAGAGSITLANATVSAAGVVAIDGDASITLADATLSATGIVGTAVSLGTLAVTLSDATVSSAGNVAIAGYANVTLADATTTGIGIVYIYGAAGITLAAATLTGTGSVTSAPVGPGTRTVLYMPTRENCELEERATLFMPAREDIIIDG